ncbi:MAG: cytochrome c [Deltaproteobacteria bacterium]|nr:cytochrome c [Deltaproteobacteria bacterium]
MRPASRILAFLAPLAVLLAIVPAVRAAGPRSGAQVWSSACAACHGYGGAGADPAMAAAPLELPDFTDCSFASREPDGDWGVVIREGGPSRAFDAWMPAFGDALTDEEISAVLDHLHAFCGEDRWPRGDLNLPKALRTEKAFPEDELLLVSRVGTGDEAYVRNKLIFEKRFGARNQVEVVVPFAALEHAPGGGWTAGIGDLALAYKRVLFANLRSGTISALTLEAALPTGDADRGLGDGHAVLEPFWTLGQILPADSFVQAQLGAGLPTTWEDYEAFGRLAVGKTFTRGIAGRSWTPMVEVLGSSAFADLAPAWTFIPQIQISLPQRQHILLDVGVGLPLEDGGIGQPEVLVYLLWDWFDGGLLEGW